MKKKIIFSDMDGTFINENLIIHKKNKDMIHELHKKGYYFAFNTGRNDQECKTVTDKAKIPYDYLVLNNGAQIIDKDGKEILKKDIPGDIGREIIEEMLKEEDLMVFFYDGKETLGYHNGVTYCFTNDEFLPTDKYDFMQEYPKADHYDILCCHNIDGSINKTKDIQSWVNEKYQGICHGTLNVIYLDVTPDNCSKGTGIEYLGNLLDATTYAIGDSYNDISMFEVADYSYTFVDSEDEIKKYCDKEVHYVYEVYEDMLKGDD